MHCSSALFCKACTVFCCALAALRESDPEWVKTWGKFMTAIAGVNECLKFQRCCGVEECDRPFHQRKGFCGKKWAPAPSATAATAHARHHKFQGSGPQSHCHRAVMIALVAFSYMHTSTNIFEKKVLTTRHPSSQPFGGMISHFTFQPAPLYREFCLCSKIRCGRLLQRHCTGGTHAAAKRRSQCTPTLVVSADHMK